MKWNNAEKGEEENSMPRTTQVVEGVVSRIELLLQVNMSASGSGIPIPRTLSHFHEATSSVSYEIFNHVLNSDVFFFSPQLHCLSVKWPLVICIELHFIKGEMWRSQVMMWSPKYIQVFVRIR